MKSVIIIIICSLVAVDSISQFDACRFQEEYRKQLDINSGEELDNEYRNIYETDQSNRGVKQNELIDLKNLIQISVLIEDYGFPLNTLDDKSYNSISAVLSHTSFSRYFFQSIITGYRNGEISDEVVNYNLTKIYSSWFNYMFCETIELNIVQEIELMANRLDYLTNSEFHISKLCNAIDDRFSYDYTTDYSILFEWKDGTTVFNISSNEKNQYLLHKQYWEGSPSFYPLIKVSDNVFAYDNDQNRIQYKMDDHRVEISNRYCDTDEKKYYFKLINNK